MKIFNSKLFKSKFFTLLIVILFIRVFYSLYVYNFKYSNLYKGKIELIITEKYNETEKSNSYLASRGFDTFIIYVSKEKDKLSLGDKINCSYRILEGEFQRNYNEFNYPLYLKSIGIINRLYIEEYNIVCSASKYSYMQEFKDYISLNFDDSLTGIIISILCGDKGLLSKDISEKFNRAGISHILVVSGTAIFILKKFLSKSLKKMKYNDIIEFIIIFFYILFCKYSLSILRAFLMYFISFIFCILKKEKGNMYKIVVTIIILLIINPYYIFNISFWYSNLAVVGIYYIVPCIVSKFNVIHLRLYNVKSKYMIRNKFKYNIERKILNSVAFTLSIQLVLFPINIYLSNSINFISIISNLLINYLYYIEYIVGFLLIIFFKVPYLNQIISFILKLFTKIIAKCVYFFSNFEFLSLKINKPWLITVIILYFVIFYIFYGHIIKFKLKYYFKSKKIFNICYIALFMTLVLVIVFNIYFSYFASFVYYFNIGQGNMSLIRSNGKVLIFDIGSSTCDISSILMDFLNGYNIDKIDYIFLSHMHSDHINGLYSLKDEIEDGKIKIGCIYANSLNTEMKNYLSELGIEYSLLKKGDKFSINNINIEILSPNFENEIHAKDMLNANSMVTSIEVNSKKLLYMGDATKETEQKIISDVAHDTFFVLQVGHHGSSTSSSKEFLQKFKFNNAIISSKKKVYNHPSENTVLNLYENNIKYYILEEKGGTRFWLY